MAKVTFIGSGDPTDSTTVTAFGHSFELGKPINIENVPAKLRGNPTFDVDGNRGGISAAKELAGSLPPGYAMKPLPGGRYEITAPALEEPKIIKGKADAKSFIDGLIEATPPTPPIE